MLAGKQTMLRGHLTDRIVRATYHDQISHPYTVPSRLHRIRFRRWMGGSQEALLLDGIRTMRIGADQESIGQLFRDVPVEDASCSDADVRILADGF